MSIADTILSGMIERAPSGRHLACVWGCEQMRDNGLMIEEVESTLSDFVNAIPQNDGGYNIRRATATWKSFARTPARDPWPDKEPRKQMSRPTPRPIRQPEPTPDPEQVERYKQMRKLIKKLKGSPAVAYLAARGIPEDIARSCGVSYCPKWEPIGESIIFPVWGENRKDIAAQARSLKGKEFNTAGPRGFGAFATNGALDSDPVGITEAPIDALTLAYAGLPSIALCGASGLSSWICKLFAERRFDDGMPCSRTIFVATDADPAGDSAAEALMTQLARYGGTVYRLRPDGAKDWNELLMDAGLCCIETQLDYAGVTLLRPEPRPDLTEDSSAWMRLLRLSRDDEPLHVELHLVRCEGARIVDGVIVGDTDGLLAPHSEAVNALLAQL